MMNNKQHELMQFGFGTELMKQIKICPTCGSKAAAGHQYCKECGENLLSDTLYDTYKKSCRVCQCCDTVVSKSTEFCPRCGARLP